MTMNIQREHKHLIAIADRMNQYELNPEDEIETVLEEIYPDLDALRGMGILATSVPTQIATHGFVR